MHLKALPNWPPGFWHQPHPPPAGYFYLVVVPQLPKIPETLPLRLLGRPKLFSEAVRELFKDSRNAWARDSLGSIVIAFRREFRQYLPNLAESLIEEEEIMNLLDYIDSVYEEAIREAKDEALSEAQTAYEAGLASQRAELEGALASQRAELEGALASQRAETEAERAAWQAEAKQQAEFEAKQQQAVHQASLIENIGIICKSYGIEFTDARQQQLATYDVVMLKQVFAALVETRRWPDAECGGADG